MGSSQVSGADFFISYTGANDAWARWIAVELERAGYTTVSQVFDFRPGDDFVHAMQNAVMTATRTVAVLSPAYAGSRFGEAEWRAAFAKDPTGELGLLIPVRVQPCSPPGLLSTRVFVDLVDVDEGTARARLREGVGPAVEHPTSVVFPGVPIPGGGKPGGFPGAAPTISNLPARNRNFSGRTAVLEELHTRLRVGEIAAVLPVEAIHGLGGVGKTELALEYAHRYRSDYEVIWWVPAAEPATAAAALIRLARRLGIAESADEAGVLAALFEHLRHRQQWLLVYDNAERPESLGQLLPSSGAGHVMITSRWSAWSRSAEPLLLKVLPRRESVQFLRGRTAIDDGDGLTKLAELLGDLPLALDEAAAYLEMTGTGLEEYLKLVLDRFHDLFGLGGPGLQSGHETSDHPDQRRVAAVWSVSLDHVRQQAPVAEALLTLWAFLAPEIPRSLLAMNSAVLPAELAAVVSDPVAYNRTLATLSRYSLAGVDPTTVSLHRLVQAVVRGRLDPSEERIWVSRAVSLLRSALPANSQDATSWAMSDQLLTRTVVVTEHARRLEIDTADTKWLLDRTSTHLMQRRGPTELDHLARLAAAGQGVTSDALLRALRPHVVLYVRSMVDWKPSLSSEYVEDMTEEVLLTIATALPRYRPDDTPVLAFALGIARQIIVASLRTDSSAGSQLIRAAHDSISPPHPRSRTTVGRADEARFREDLARLPDKQREVLMMRIVMGYSAEEVASVIGSSPGAVRIVQHRALVKLRKLIEDWAPDDG